MPIAALEKRSWLRSDRLVLYAAGLLALCAIAFAAALLMLSRQHDVVMNEIASARAARLATFSLMQASIDAETGQRGYLLTENEDFLAPYQRGAAAAFVHLERLRVLASGDPEMRAIVERADTQARSAIELLTRSISLSQQDRLGHAQMIEMSTSSKAAMDALRVEVAALMSTAERRIDAARAREERARAALYWVGAALAALSIAAALLTVFALRVERRSWRDALGVMVKANLEAENARAAASASDLAKTRFLAAASHDMRQPLHALTLYLSALQRRVENPEARDILGKAERATQSLVGMFATLLDLARIQADVVKPDIETFPLQDMLDRLIGEHPGENVKGPTPPTTLLVRSDPVLLERMLRNLINNALKHGGGSARVTVSQRGGAAEIAVIDKGPGIPFEDQDRVFEEFVRLDGRAGAEGLGLGLAIVKRIAELLGVELELHSAPGQGATFLVRVPIVQGAAATPTRRPAQARSLAGAPVLVMDDDAMALGAAAGALRDQGADVRPCANEAEARAILAQGFRPAILVMDLRIDGELAGVEIANRLRAPIDPKPRVIMMTGDTAPETLGALRASGHRWLIKPVSPADLAEAAQAARAEAT